MGAQELPALDKSPLILSDIDLIISVKCTYINISKSSLIKRRICINILTID